MHYYKFNIADYRKDTVHLTPVEHYIYRSLIDWYYLDELPIPKETQSVIRRLCLGIESVSLLENVLNDFFKLSETGYIHKRIDVEIAEYHDRNNTNTENGKKGGRPPKAAGKRKKTESVKSANRNESEINPNYKLETINYKLPPSNEGESAVDLVDFRPSTITAITVALRSLGVKNIIQTHPHFVRLVAEGAEVQEFIDAGKVAMSTGKPFAYVVAIVKRQREEMQQAIKDKPAQPVGKVSNWMSSLELTHERCKQEGVEVIDDLRQLRINLNDHIQSQYR